jgi:hypothetical protein
MGESQNNDEWKKQGKYDYKHYYPVYLKQPCQRSAISIYRKWKVIHSHVSGFLGMKRGNIKRRGYYQ